MSEAQGSPAEKRLVRTSLRSAIRIAAVLALLAAAWLAREVLLLAFFAVVLAVVLSFPVGLLARVMPRGAAVLLMLLLGAAAATGLGALAAPTLSRQFDQLSEVAPRALSRARGWLDKLQGKVGAESAAGGVGSKPSGGAGNGGEAQPVARLAAAGLAAAAEIVGTLTKLVLLLVLAAFLVYEPDVYRRGLRRLVPPEREQAFDELWGRLGAVLRHWVGGILVSMATMGTLAALGLLAIGIDGWLVLGVLTFLGTFVPYLGAVASAVPGLLVALAQSPRHFLLALVVYLGVHLVEGYLVEPLVMRRAVEIKPGLLLTFQALLGAVFGILGIVVATPALACLQAAVDYLWVERRLGKDARATT